MIPHSSGYKPLVLPITLLQRLVPRLSGAPAHFCFLGFFALGSFGQVRLPLSATLCFTRAGTRTRNTHPTPGPLYRLSYLALVEGDTYIPRPSPLSRSHFIRARRPPCRIERLYHLKSACASTTLQEEICRHLAEI